MHPTIYREFERICRERFTGGTVLEIGAVPSGESLLCMKPLGGVTEKVGINLDPPSEFGSFKIVQGNANRMACFEDNRFDLVLCNAVLEHDPFFWLTLAEIRRVAKPGALVVIGTPGYTQLPAERFKKTLRRIPWLGRILCKRLDWAFASTLTLLVHNFPGDFYRFSPQAFREVFFRGMTEVEVISVMVPPRMIGVGRIGAEHFK